MALRTSPAQARPGRPRLARLLFSLILLSLLAPRFAPPTAAAGGVLDPSFGSGFGPDGSGMIALGGADYSSLAVAPDGRIIVGGTRQRNDFVVARYRPDGGPDTSFGSRGEQAVPIGPGAYLADTALAPDGQIVLGGSTDVRTEDSVDGDFYAARLRAAGQPDSGFGAGGVVQTNFDSATINEESIENAAGVLVQPDGKIILAGDADSCGITSCLDSGFAAVRYLANGQLDSSFDDNGKAYAQFEGEFLAAEAYARTAILLRDGSLLIAGGRNNNGAAMAVALFDGAGRLDSRFDGDGLMALSYGTAQAVVELASGNLALASEDRRMIWIDRSGDFVLLNNSASIDLPIFPSSIVTQPLRVGGSEREYILVAGTLEGQAALTRVAPDRSIDRSFGLNGVVSLPEVGPIRDIALTSDGRILALSNNRLARLRPDGRLDTGAGFITTDAAPRNDSIADLAIAPDGSIYAVGSGVTVASSGAGFQRMFTAHYSPGGALVTSFDFDGIYFDSGSRPSVGSAVAVSDQGWVISAGAICKGVSPCGGYDLHVRSTLLSGRSSVARTLDLGPGDDMAFALEASGGRLLVGGRAGSQLVLLQLDPRTLAADPGFSGDGRVTLSLASGSFARANAIARQADGKILVAGTYYPPGSDDAEILLLRLTAAGELDRSFSGAGWLTVNYGTGEDYADSLIIQPDGRIVVGGVVTPGGRDTLALLRFSPQGDREYGFGANGVAGADFGARLFGGDAALLDDGTFLISGYTNDGDRREAIVARFTRDGQLDQSFDGDGMAVLSFGSSEDLAAAVAAHNGQAFIGGSAVYQSGNSVSVLARLAPVAGQNLAPVAEDDLFGTGHGVSLAVPAPGVLGNDYDNNGDALRAELVSPPANGTLVLFEGGGFSYTPGPGFAGQDSFSYRAGDGLQESATALVTIVVERAEGNRAPEPQPDRYYAAQGVPLRVAAPGPLGNDSDPDGDSLSAVLAGAPENGTVSLEADGELYYRPRAGFSGADRFSYRALDLFDRSEPVEVVIVVAPAGADSPPNAVADHFSAGPGGLLELPALGVLANDRDPDDDPLTAELVSPPVAGTLELRPDGALRYQAPLGLGGRVSFSYRAVANSLASEPVTVTIVLGPGGGTGEAPIYQVQLPLLRR